MRPVRGEQTASLPLSTPTVSVHIPPALRKKTAGRGRIDAQGQTVGDVVHDLERQFPGLLFEICHETGEVRPYVNIFLDNENIKSLRGLDTSVAGGAELYILQSVAGG